MFLRFDDFIYDSLLVNNMSDGEAVCIYLIVDWLYENYYRGMGNTYIAINIATNVHTYVWPPTKSVCEVSNFSTIQFW